MIYIYCQKTHVIRNHWWFIMGSFLDLWHRLFQHYLWNAIENSLISSHCTCWRNKLFNWHITLLSALSWIKILMFPTYICLVKNFLIIRKIKIKITMSHHLMSIRIAIIKKTRNDECWWECGEEGILMPTWRECEMVQPLWKTVWRVHKKLKIEL